MGKPSRPSPRRFRTNAGCINSSRPTHRYDFAAPNYTNALCQLAHLNFGGPLHRCRRHDDAHRRVHRSLAQQPVRRLALFDVYGDVLNTILHTSIKPTSNNQRPVPNFAMNETNPLDENSTTTPATPRRRRWVPLLITLAIFASGAIVGTCGTLMYVRQQIHHRLHHPEEFPARIAARIAWKLDLSEEQTQQVETLLTTRQKSIRKIRREYQPQLEAELEQLAAQISEVLTDEQRTKWQTWFQAVRTEWLPQPIKEEADE